MDRWLVLLALVGCAPERSAAVSEGPEPARWVVAPPPSGFPLAPIIGRLGRSQAPQPLVRLGIRGPAALAPLHLAAAWPIPGDGAARAVLYGTDGARPAIELVEVDAGRIVWRDLAQCAAPIVGVTAETIVCADAAGTRAVGLDGKRRWQTAASFIAFTDERVAVTSVTGRADSTILDADTGDELARVALPGGLASDEVIATCGDAGRELFAVGRDGALARVAEATGGPAVQWVARLARVEAIDACDGATVIVTEQATGGRALVALARSTGKPTGRVDGVLGAWPARDGSAALEVATARGVSRYPRDLAGPGELLALPPLGELLAARGERRLVRATPLTAVVLDRAGVRAYLPLATLGAVLGDASVLATSWLGAPGEVAHRLALPAAWRVALRVPPRRAGVAVDAELRDLPAVAALDEAAALALPGTAAASVAAYALDPDDGAAVYAAAVEHVGEPATVARLDLSARRWRWRRDDGCGPGARVALAVARDVVVCAAGGDAPGATVRATGRDGLARWEWRGAGADGVAAAGDVVAVRDADRLIVLDARDGRVRGAITSDDGAPVRAAIIPRGGAALVVAAERGRLVARLGNAGLLPVWSIAVAGVVAALSPAGDGVLVELEDGDAYRVSANGASISSVPGLGLRWHAAGDLLAGSTTGGPLPGVAPPPAPPTPAQLLRRPLQLLRGEIHTPPPMSTPIATPPPLGDSWQLALFELGGGLRARSDYALASPVAPPAPRGPAGSPVVVAYGRAPREVVVLDPRAGDPVRRARLPEEAGEGAVFGTVVDGSPVAGVVLGAPLRVVLF